MTYARIRERNIRIYVCLRVQDIFHNNARRNIFVAATRLQNGLRARRVYRVLYTHTYTRIIFATIVVVVGFVVLLLFFKHYDKLRRGLACTRLNYVATTVLGNLIFALRTVVIYSVLSVINTVYRANILSKTVDYLWFIYTMLLINPIFNYFRTL